VTPPHSKPPPDVLTRLITRLERQLAGPGHTNARVASRTHQGQVGPHGDLESYLAQRIEKALAPLRTLLDEADVSFIGALLRERLATDPNLTRLVRRLRK
jgi:hypothetical protein